MIIETDREERTRVLVVDDEPGIVDVLSMALRHHGFGVQSADTGQDALERVRRWRPHVVVLDVMLPDMEGFEVARRLAAEHAAVPILFLSARDTTADKIRGLTTGGDDYVTKPFSLEELPNPNFSGNGPVFPASIRSNAKFQAASRPCQNLLAPAGAPGQTGA